jgi:alpha-mannosidase
MKQLVALLFAFASVSFSQTSYIKDWLILGSFSNADASTRLSRDYLGGESSIVPRGGEVVKGQQWMLFHSSADILDFVGSDKSTFGFSDYEECVVYTACFVQSPKDQTARLLVGSDDGVAVWCNGERKHFNDANRGVVPDNDTILVSLKNGWNTVLFKVANELGGFGLCARFADSDGLIVQADNPFPPATQPTPASISFTASVPDLHFALTEKNRAVLQFAVNLLNHGSSTGKGATVTAYAGDAKFSQMHIPVIRGGEVLGIPEQIPFLQAVESCEKGDSLTVGVDVEKTNTLHRYGFSNNLLVKLFEPWELQGWKETVKDTTAILSRTIVVPNDLTGFGLEFMVDIGDTWGKILVNGQEKLPRFSGDSGDLTLTTNAAANDTFRVDVFVASNKSIRGPVVKNSCLRVRWEAVERYVSDARFAKDIYAADISDGPAMNKKLLSLIEEHRVGEAEDALKDFHRQTLSLSQEAKKSSLHFVGNAHIDMVWLWRYTESIDVVKQTFQAAIDNLKAYPDFKFSHGQAQSYFWMEEKYPELFHEIQKYVKEGRWEIVGGTWVESDANMPSGESLVRQYLYGKRYFKKKFGVDVKHGWYPDTFGHPASLPQILSKCGIETYTFFRPWDEERMFVWESPDGSRVFAHRPPDWYGTWTAISDTVWKTVKESQKKFKVNTGVQFYGVGDHGGGPTRRQINMVQHLGSLNVYPAVKLSTFDAFYADLLSAKKDAPVQHGEQNSVFEGCYTSQAMVKLYNRKAEALLPTAELFSTIAMRFGFVYPSEQFEEAWRKVLFNQFHDMLCGSGVHDIYVDGQQFYDDAFQRARGAMNGAFSVIAKNISTSSKVKKATPLVLFNPLNWKRTEPMEIVWKTEQANFSPKIIDESGKELPSQVTERWKDSVRVVFIPKDVPSVGYKTYWITSKKESPSKSRNDLGLENQFYMVQVDSATGSVSRIYDKVHKREVIQPGALANQIQLQDDEAGMSAWVIGLKGSPQSVGSPKSISVIENGRVRKIIRVEYRLDPSSFTEDVVLYSNIPRIDFRFSAAWHHRKKILKIAFPLNIDSPKATFDIPYGTIQRDTVNGKEVVTQKWADLGGADYGVSLLNDSKYGCDVNGNIVRLTGLRASTDPDPTADEGDHEFFYALYPHAGNWQEAMTVQRGYEFNTPMVMFSTDQHSGSLPPAFSFITLEAPSIVLTALKKCEDDNSFILRCYETAGKSSQVEFRFWNAVSKASSTNLVEWDEKELKDGRVDGTSMRLGINPYEIKTLKLELARRR